MGRVAEMRAFMQAHRGETYTATGLARAVGWVKTKKRKVKTDENTEIEQAFEMTNSGKARSISRKSGAQVFRGAEHLGKKQWRITL